MKNDRFFNEASAGQKPSSVDESEDESLKEQEDSTLRWQIFKEVRKELVKLIKISTKQISKEQIEELDRFSTRIQDAIYNLQLALILKDRVKGIKTNPHLIDRKMTQEKLDKISFHNILGWNIVDNDFFEYDEFGEFHLFTIPDSAFTEEVINFDPDKPFVKPPSKEEQMQKDYRSPNISYEDEGFDKKESLKDIMQKDWEPFKALLEKKAAAESLKLDEENVENHVEQKPNIPYKT